MCLGLGLVGHVVLLLAANSGGLIQLVLAARQPALHSVHGTVLSVLDVVVCILDVAVCKAQKNKSAACRMRGTAMVTHHHKAPELLKRHKQGMQKGQVGGHPAKTYSCNYLQGILPWHSPSVVGLFLKKNFSVSHL